MKIKRVTNKTFVLTAAIGSILIMLMVTVNNIWSVQQTQTATNNAVSAVSSFYLEAMADRRAKTITNLISNNFSQMEKALTVFSCSKSSSSRMAIFTFFINCYFKLRYKIMSN